MDGGGRDLKVTRSRVEHQTLTRLSNTVNSIAQATLRPATEYPSLLECDHEYLYRLK